MGVWHNLLKSFKNGAAHIIRTPISERFRCVRTPWRGTIAHRRPATAPQPSKTKVARHAILLES
eukprot:1757939-Amphidinium_carterae.1